MFENATLSSFEQPLLLLSTSAGIKKFLFTSISRHWFCALQTSQYPRRVGAQKIFSREPKLTSNNDIIARAQWKVLLAKREMQDAEEIFDIDTMEKYPFDSYAVVIQSAPTWKDSGIFLR